MARTPSVGPEHDAQGGTKDRSARQTKGRAAGAAKTPSKARRRAAGAKAQPPSPRHGHPQEAAGPAPSAFAKGAPAAARIRMYRQGLGDCFLVTLPRAAGSQKSGDFQILIDCGVILGTENKAGRLRQVVQDIIRDTGGVVDVLVVTHEHYDHVSGFVLADDLFAQAPAPGKLTVGEVWFSWTENPADPVARKLQADRDAKKHKLAAMLMAMTGVGMAETAAAQGLAGILSFFGVDFSPGQPQIGMSQALAARPAPGMPKPKGDTGLAMDFARSLVAPENIHYRRPGEAPWTSPELADLRIYVLGPPLAPELLRKTYASSEVYHLAGDADGLDALYAAAQGVTADDLDAIQDWSDACPFDTAYGPTLPGPTSPNAGSLPADWAAFLDRHYAGLSDDVFLPDQSWRRIDGDWAGGAAQFALQLDAATNNTSLVLALEFGGSPGTGPVLLFPGDAQIGSWLSWQTAAWPANGEAPRVTGPDLLARTAFYKVGHHGSENATARAKGLELMPDAETGGELTAFMPVDHAMAVTKGWNDMPLESLTDALTKRTGGRLVRVDEPLPPTLQDARVADREFDPRVEGKEPGEDPLYYEVALDLAHRRTLAAPAVAEVSPAPRARKFGFGAAPASLLDQVTPERVRHLFPDTPVTPIRTNLPFVLAGLRARDLADRDMLLMALATIRAETEGFVPIDEGRSHFNTRTTPFDLYEPGTEIGKGIGNTQRGDGARFKGRGYVQLTGRDNYTRIGPQIGADLVTKPALANDPTLAGLILAQFLKNKEKAVRQALAANDLRKARRLVNGGSHGLPQFKDAFRRGLDEFQP
jgi:hypothetical protein